MELTLTKGMTISNVDFQPFQPDRDNPACGPDSLLHLETIRVNDGVDDFLLERSRFHRGDGSGTARLFVSKLQPAGSGQNSNRIRVVNNWFGAAEGSASVLLGENQVCAGGYVFAYNLWEGGFDDACPQGRAQQPHVRGQRGHAARLPALSGHDRGPQRLDLVRGTDRLRDRHVGDRPLQLPRRPRAGRRRLPPHGRLARRRRGPARGGVQAAHRRCRDIDGDPRRGTCDAGPDEPLAAERR